MPKKYYTGGIYKMILDNGLTFEKIEFTKKDAKAIFKSMEFYGYRVKKIDFVEQLGDAAEMVI